MTSRQRDEREAIGRSRGGRTTKCHAVCDQDGRLRHFLLTAGQRNDKLPIWELLDAVPLETEAVVADKGYDSIQIREWLTDHGIKPVIPQRGVDGQRPSHNRNLYRQRNLIERASNRMKDYRRFATRFDKLGLMFEATICLIAARTWFLF